MLKFDYRDLLEYRINTYRYMNYSKLVLFYVFVYPMFKLSSDGFSTWFSSLLAYMFRKIFLQIRVTCTYMFAVLDLRYYVTRA